MLNFSFKALAGLSFATLAVLASGKVTLKEGFVADQEIILPGADSVSNTTAPPGHTAAPLRWFGQAFAQGPNITIVGINLDQILSALREMNPDFDTHNKKVLETQPKSVPPSIRHAKRQESVRF